MYKKIVLVLFVFLAVIILFKGESMIRIIKDTVTNTSKQTVEEAVDNIDIEKKNKVDEKFDPQNIDNTYKELTIIALKEEKLVEVWSTSSEGKKVKLITYPITAASGKMGPKLAEGDRQVPEGIYTLEYLNPNSSYHLSMKLNYPNNFDREMAKQEGRKNLGGDIFIHGKSVSIGCIAIGDSAIEELFYMVTKIGKDNVKVIVAPRDLRIKDVDTTIVNLDWYSVLVDTIKQELQSYK